MLSSAGPTPRGYFGMAYDEARDEVVLYGGYDGDRDLGDTWVFSDMRWRQVS
jgi:hypothetical protein